MFGLFNGTLFNGSPATHYWAWGRGEVTGTAESSAVPRAIRAFKGTSVGQAQSTSLSDRTAFSNSTFNAQAETSIKATRYAAFEGSASGEAVSVLFPKRYAWSTLEPVESMAQSQGTTTVDKPVSAISQALALTTLPDDSVVVYKASGTVPADGRAFTWAVNSIVRRPAQTGFEAQADSGPVTPRVYRGFSGSGEATAHTESESRINRWRRMQGESQGSASSQLFAKKTTPAQLSPTSGEALSEAVNKVYSWFEGVSAEAEASTQGENRRQVYFTGETSATASVSLDALASRGVLATGVFEGYADSQSVGLRWTYAEGSDEEGIACTSRFNFAINIDPSLRAPHPRTYIMSPEDRVYVVPLS